MWRVCFHGSLNRKMFYVKRSLSWYTEQVLCDIIQSEFHEEHANIFELEQTLSKTLALGLLLKLATSPRNIGKYRRVRAVRRGWTCGLVFL